MSTTRWLAETARVVARASARAANGFAPDPGQRPSPQHIVTVTPRPQIDGQILYAAECSCGNWLCTDATEDKEARERAKEHAAPDVVHDADRPEMPMAVYGRNGKVIQL